MELHVAGGVEVREDRKPVRVADRKVCARRRQDEHRQEGEEDHRRHPGQCQRPSEDGVQLVPHLPDRVAEDDGQDDGYLHGLPGIEAGPAEVYEGVQKIGGGRI